MKDTPVVLATMTVSEAIEHLPDPERALLKRWCETFGIALAEFHMGHILTYQKDRGEETDARTVNLELKTLLDLLRRLQLGKEIDRSYRALREQKPDDVHCLYRETFVKKDGTVRRSSDSAASRPRSTAMVPFLQFCSEHRREVNETFLRLMDPNGPASCVCARDKDSAVKPVWRM